MASILGKPGSPGQFPTHDLSTVWGALQSPDSGGQNCTPNDTGERNPDILREEVLKDIRPKAHVHAMI
jgi:hypothetical protein